MKRWSPLARSLAFSYPSAFNVVCTLRLEKAGTEGKSRRHESLEAFARLCDVPTFGEEILTAPIESEVSSIFYPFI